MAMHKKSASLAEKISILPDTPGVYMYRDAEGTVIYVGKAKNLKRRVSSYFNRTHDSLRTNLLVRAIADMEYIVVPTEQDALNLEASMIKEYQPRYNVLLKDDKSYPWIVVTNETYPKVFMTRQHIKDGSRYYGPYTDVGSARATLDLVRRLYSIRSCRQPMTLAWVKAGKGRLCLDYHLKRCKGCCTGLISAEDYNKDIDKVRAILRGETGELLAYLRSEMEALSMEMRFEEAQELKEQYDLIRRYQAKSVIVSQTIEDIDVFGIDDEDSEVYINYMHVRRGAVVKSVTLEYKRRLDESRAQLLGYAMAEIARSLGVVYDEVIVAEEPDVEMPDVKFIIPQRGDKAKLLEVSEKNARQHRIDRIKTMEKRNPETRTERILQRMQADFRLSQLPRHIECFDNSNIQGTNPVASCVVFKDAKPSKKDYRHFNIKTVVGPDDFASMKEVLTRRYSRLVAEEKELPQLKWDCAELLPWSESRSALRRFISRVTVFLFISIRTVRPCVWCSISVTRPTASASRITATAGANHRRFPLSIQSRESAKRRARLFLHILKVSSVCVRRMSIRLQMSWDLPKHLLCSMPSTPTIQP